MTLFLLLSDVSLSSDIEFVGGPQADEGLYLEDVTRFNYSFSVDVSSWEHVFVGDAVEKLADPLVHTSQILQDLPLLPE